MKNELFPSAHRKKQDLAERFTRLEDIAIFNRLNPELIDYFCESYKPLPQ
jgi:hypothetical protein